jgi:hypothetical protein
MVMRATRMRRNKKGMKVMMKMRKRRRAMGR